MNACNEKDLITPLKWQIFIRERFNPLIYLPLTGLFTLVNAVAAVAIVGGKLRPQDFALSFATTIMLLFRLRCFDEIKDYQDDLKLNPLRPLPRGLLSINQTKVMIALLVLIELGLTAILGFPVFLTHTLAVAYSFLMYKEFFIGRWLRPRPIVYAITHTAVSALLGWSVSSQVTGLTLFEFPTALLLFGLVNWLIFIVFEFSRRTA